MRTALLFLIVALGATQTATASSDWDTLRGCRLIPNEFNDGDSFHVEANGRRYIFRLYHVDAPETSEQIADRVIDQALHFGVTVDEVMRGGDLATAFMERVLRQPFTVTTRWQNARGMSARPRYYAVVTTAEGKDLAELLIRSGLARAYGVRARAPRGLTMADYQFLERRARQDGAGLFGGLKDVSTQRAEQPKAVLSEVDPEQNYARPSEQEEESKTNNSAPFGWLFDEIQREGDGSSPLRTLEFPVQNVPAYRPRKTEGETQTQNFDNK